MARVFARRESFGVMNTPILNKRVAILATDGFLIEAALVKGRRLTSWPAIQTDV